MQPAKWTRVCMFVAIKALRLVKLILLRLLKTYINTYIHVSRQLLEEERMRIEKNKPTKWRIKWTEVYHLAIVFVLVWPLLKWLKFQTGK